MKAPRKDDLLSRIFRKRGKLKNVDKALLTHKNITEHSLNITFERKSRLRKKMNSHKNHFPQKFFNPSSSNPYTHLNPRPTRKQIKREHERQIIQRLRIQTKALASSPPRGELGGRRFQRPQTPTHKRMPSLRPQSKKDDVVCSDDNSYDKEGKRGRRNVHKLKERSDNLFDKAHLSSFQNS